MTKYDDIIYEIAADNFGLITSSEAREAGLKNMELVQYARRGKLTRIGQGLYQLTQRIPEANDSYAIATALVGSEAYLYGEGVLGLLDLCPVNPAYITVATTKRIRKKLPKHIRVINRKQNDSVKVYEGIRAQSVADAIRSCMTTVLPDRLMNATEKALMEGYINQDQRNELVSELEELA